ncbi:NUDIX hydrolase [Flagellimonas allohymeniacidonis]|uniref:NUDIX domain-containing protein n=1 Tax=Flagellimonas allohymeniacidonis TaxID=2517819 RepID=A0A4Q8QH78_9FLAO|nr:NUDIX domain-containing protein [Allomuricauda hymeniacidonis]TAI49107.1 NUDIX domain-containing protein [Allomuricauda hymeniacidonis]
MDEMVDLLDEKGNYLGKSILKSEAHRKGLYHPTVHVWCYTSKGQILLQLRGKDKATFPLKWDVSVAGHVGTGESLEVAAVREVQEEIGLKISQLELEKIAVFRTENRHSESLMDREFNHTYLCRLDARAKLQKQESEVADLRWFSLNHFKEWVEENHTDLVPNSGGRYERVIEEIESRI